MKQIHIFFQNRNLLAIITQVMCFVIIILLPSLSSCLKDEIEETNYVPTKVVTSVVTVFSDVAATLNADLTAPQPRQIVRGFCWSTSQSPTILNSKWSETGSLGAVSYNITGLTPSTTYYIRSYTIVSNSETIYGNEVSFTTKSVSIPTNTVSDIDGNIYHTVTIGTQTWMVENLRTSKYRDGSIIPNVTVEVTWTGLTTGAWCNYNNDVTNDAKYGKLYNWYAVNDNRNIAPVGWHVPSDAEWTNLINFMGGETVAGGKLKEVGFSHWESPNLAATNEIGFNILPSGCIFNSFYNIGRYGYYWSSTKYDAISVYYRGFSFQYSAVNRNPYGGKNDGFSVRCVKGESSPAITSTIPTVSTNSLSTITQTTAVGGGNVTSDGGSTVTSKGVCWSTSTNPTIANSSTNNGTFIGAFTSTLTTLSPNTTYYVRAYATNSMGTAYGNQVSFTTSSTSTSSTVSDIDGNIYQTVIIGNQTWMVENLKTTRYNDGTSIPLVTTNTAWSLLSSPAYCWYNNDISTYKNTYGALYNWYCVNTGKLSPVGWHIPTDAEWTTLTTYLGGESVAGDQLKVAGTIYWISGNTGNNDSRFSALPGGARNSGSGTFDYLGIYAFWWSSTEYSTSDAWNRNLNYNLSNVFRLSNKKSIGFSVRCVKNL